jgi:outer membrane receptor protein involved in Fe transport
VAGQDNPNNLRFCDQTTPFRNIFKLSGGIPLPYRIMVSGNFQIYDTPGSGLFLGNPYFAAVLPVSTALAGRTVTGGQTSTGSISVNLLAPNTIFQDYYKVLDIRFAKSMTMGKLNLTPLAEFENIFNMRSINSVTENYGSNWLRPATVQRGRTIRFGLQARF